jgi:hypothetical protein
VTKLEPDDQWILGYQLFWTNSNMGYIYKMNLTAVLLMTWWCGFVWTFTHPKSHVFKRHFLIKVAMLDYAPILFNHIYIHMYVTSASLKWYVYTIHIHILLYRQMEYISWYQICIHHHVYSIMIHYCQCTSWYVMGPALRTMDYSSPLVVAGDWSVVWHILSTPLTGTGDT